MRRVLAKIESDPKHWDQSGWVTRSACGTAYCFGAWALVLSGIPMSPLSWAVLMEDLPGDVQVMAQKHLHMGARLVPIPVAAMVVLGLDRNEAAILFRVTNSLARIKELVDGFAAPMARA
jgi:hypothetical protein